MPITAPRRIIRLLALCALAWIIWTVLRSHHLLTQTKQLAQQSQQFPRDYYIGNPKSPILTYCVLGDSTAFGCGAQHLSGTCAYQVAQAVASQGYRVHVLNFAVIGATIRDVRLHQLATMASIHPNLITVSIGANDTTHFTSPNDYSQELGLVLAKLEASGANQILFANTPDMVLAPALPWVLSIVTGRRAIRQNEILERELAGSKVEMVDLYGKGKLDYHRDANLYAADLFHPSESGYRVWAGVFAEGL